MKRRKRTKATNLPPTKRGVLFKTTKPLPHESVSSWLQRFGRAHAVTPHEVLSRVCGIDEPLVDIDLELTPRETAHLAHFSHLDKKAFLLSDYLFRPLRRKIIFPPQPKNPCQWLIERPSGTKPHFAFCPDCLRDDDVPYWRVEWRFRHWLVCPAHRCWLLDRCSHCGKRPDLCNPGLVRYAKRRRSVALPATLAQCMHCNRNLHAGEAIKPDRLEGEYYVLRQKALLSTLVNEYCILRPSTKKWPVETAVRYLRQKKLHPVDVDYRPARPAEEGKQMLLANLRFDFQQHLRRRCAEGLGQLE